MWPVIGAGAAILGAAAISGAGQYIANRQQIGLARDQMAFQEDMSSTAYQRAVKDMEAAGLNPMLAYSQGGASSPGGAMPVIGNVGGAAVAGLSSAAGAEQAFSQAERTRAETMPNEMLVKKLDTEITQLSSQIFLNDAKRQLLYEEARKAAIEAGIAERVAEIRTKAELAIWFRDMQEAVNAGKISAGEFGDLLKWLERIMPLFRGYGGGSILRR